MYIQRQLTTREVAAEFGISKARVRRELAAAGIERSPRSTRRPRGARAKVTDEALVQVYQRDGLTIAQARAHFGVSDEYLRRRIAEAVLTRRPGNYRPRTPYPPAALRDRAVELYAGGLTMHQVGDELGVSGTTVSTVLHAAKAPIRPNTAQHNAGADRARVLFDDLHTDPVILEILRRHDVAIPGGHRWRLTGPYETYAPHPLPAALLRELYLDVGLAIQTSRCCSA